VARAGMRLTVDELTHDIGVPVYRALVSDSAFPGREGASTRFEGFGADLDACHAVSRAVCEAVQAHTTVLVGARDTFEGGQVLRVGVDRWLEWLQAPSSTTPFTPPDSGEPSSDLAQRLQVVLERLRSAGFGHCVVVDLTRQDLGVPVVRVLLAGAASPYGETARRPCARLLRALV
jgi:ribosomal protein S12 methylthiotransferase accessory factor YcaO